MVNNEKIKFQLSKLDVELFENSDKIIEVTVVIGSGVGEKEKQELDALRSHLSCLTIYNSLPQVRVSWESCSAQWRI